MPVNGAKGMSDIEGKAAREAVSECGQRPSFNGLHWLHGMWPSDREIVSQRAGSERIKSFGVSRMSAEGHMANYQAARRQRTRKSYAKRKVGAACAI